MAARAAAILGQIGSSIKFASYNYDQWSIAIRHIIIKMYTALAGSQTTKLHEGLLDNEEQEK